MKTITSLVASLFLISIGQLTGQTSFTLNLGGPANVETIQSSFIFADSGITATATAWSMSRTASNPSFVQSEVVRWSPGLGVKNSSEVITNVPYVPFYVDNEDHYDFVLFVFSGKVDVTQVRVHPSAGTFDLDTSFWLGNVSPSVNLSGQSLAGLSSLGLGSRIDNDGVASNSPRNVPVMTPAGGVNAMLFGARINGDSSFDRFKISSVNATTVIPEPSSAAMMILLGGLALCRRKRA